MFYFSHLYPTNSGLQPSVIIHPPIRRAGLVQNFNVILNLFQDLNGMPKQVRHDNGILLKTQVIWV